jgi:exodeoxyribonuclease-5/deoxyribonuclease V
MILAFDTYYFNNKAKTVCLAFKNWNETEDFKTYSETLEGIEDYSPGEFYKRELPCILSLFEKIESENIEAIIIDGFVFLDDDNKPGLGAHLYKSLNETIPVIGVAKTNFATLQTQKRSVLRGESRNPLFITSVGMNMDEAAELIKNLPGEYRIPTILKQLDSLTREFT